MKRVVVSMAVGGILGMCFVAGTIIRDLNHKTWMEYTPGEIDRLAIDVETFRQEQGVYPEKLSDLQDVYGLQDKQYLKDVIQRNSATQYSYRTVSNGFAITATKPAGLLSKEEMMHRFFAPGMSPGGEVKTIMATESGGTNGVLDDR